MSDRSNTNNKFDALSDVWNTLRLKGSIFFRSDLGAPWGISLPQEGIPRFHICFRGSFVVGSETAPAVRASAGQIVLLPKGGPHWIADQANRSMVACELAGEACELNDPLFQNTPLTESIMCGMVKYDLRLPHPVFGTLPEIILFDWFDDNSRAWKIANILNTETEINGHNSSPIIDRLAEVLMLQLVDEYQQHSGNASGFLGALSDRRVRKALELIHSEPGSNWSLEALGDASGMSRATLVRRFQEELGEAPMTYVANWRLAKAFDLITNSAIAIDEIANQMGFASARTLNRAFKRRFGITPKRLRNQGNQSLPGE